MGFSALDNKFSVIFYLRDCSDNYAESDAEIYTKITRCLYEGYDVERGWRIIEWLCEQWFVNG